MDERSTTDIFRSGDVERASEISRAVLADPHQATQARIDALCMLARVALRHCDRTFARQHADQAHRLATDIGAPELQQMPLHLLAAVARLEGDLAKARVLYRMSIALNQQLGHDGPVAVERRNLAYVELQLGDTDTAYSLLQQARQQLDRDGAHQATHLLDIAAFAAHSGDDSTAADALAALSAHLADSEQCLDPDDEAEYRRLQRIRMLGLGDDIADR